MLNHLDVDKANKYYGEYRAYSGRYYRPYGDTGSTTTGSMQATATAAPVGNAA